MKQQPLLTIMAVLMIACHSCTNNDGFTKAASGFRYKIIKAAQPGDSLRQGDVVKIQLHQYIDDSLLNTTIGKMPDYVQVDSALKPFDYIELLPLMQVHDSAVCLFPTSKIIERAGKDAKVPDYLKKGKYVKVFFKVLTSFTDEMVALLDREKAQNDLIGYTKEDTEEGLKRAAVSFDSLIKTLPQKPNRLPSGVYVHVTQKGSGAKVKKGQEIGVILKGKLMNGTVVDETTAKAPFLIHADSGESLPGFDAAVATLSIGDKATLYIPAPLAYGAKRAGEYIPPFSNFIFDVEIIDPLEKKN